MVLCMEVRGDLDPKLAFQSERLVEVVDYWHAVRGDRPMPSRRHVDPLAIPGHLLPHLELIDVLHHPKLRFRWRLIGTHVTAAVGRDQTGRYFDEIYPGDDFATVSEPFKWVVDNAQPLRWFGTSAFIGRDWQAYEGVYLPLSDDATRVDMIFAGVQYDLR